LIATVKIKLVKVWLQLQSPKAKPQVSKIEKVIRGGETGKRDARWHKITFTLDFFSISWHLTLFPFSKILSV